MKPAIAVSGLSKSFRRFHADRPWTIQEALAQGLRRWKPVERFMALRDVSFRVEAGRTVGIVGSNGSGKSTLLRLTGGVGRPDRGSVEVDGRIGALLDLGAGFHADLTGRENAMIGGILSGLTRRQVLERFDAIVEFAEVEKFIDSPLRTYSTGMQMRLAFSTAVHADPDILLIDEVLSVGDLGFQRKCLDRIAQFKASGCSILLVSHETSMVQDLCDEAIWLSGGRLLAHGPASDVVRQYVAHMNSREATPEPGRDAPLAPAAAAHPVVRTDQGTTVILDENRFGSVELKITRVRVLDELGRPTPDVHSGHPVQVEIEYLATTRVVAPLFRVRILRQDGLVCYDLNTERSPLSLSAVEGQGRLSVHLGRLDLNSATYFVDVGCYSQDWAYAYDHQSSVCSVIVHGDAVKDAVLNVPHRWEVKPAAAMSKR